MSECPMGGPRCPESICDCFIDLYPDDPTGLHPEAFVVGHAFWGTDPSGYCGCDDCKAPDQS